MLIARSGPTNLLAVRTDFLNRPGLRPGDMNDPMMGPPSEDGSRRLTQAAKREHISGHIKREEKVPLTGMTLSALTSSLTWEIE